MSPDSLERLLASFRGQRVTVVGDLMLDEYVWGDVARISPDAPVQVVEIRHRSQAVGGAGNVAHNLAAAGAVPALVSVVGDDEAGAALVRGLHGAGVETGGVLVDSGRPTTVKTRVIARGQQIVRLDQEVSQPLDAGLRAGLMARLEPVIGDGSAVVVSDYAKGVVDKALVPELASHVQLSGRGIPLIVDPKSADLAAYSGCTAITPNQREAEIAARMALRTDADLLEAARRIRGASGARWVLITRGEKGMALLGPEDQLELISARSREVYDVTGAGDTVLAYFSLALAAGASAREAAEIANLAAGVKIGKVGTSAVGPAEILAWQPGARAAGKIPSLREVLARVEHLRSVGRRIVFTNGCFDLLHAGHIHLLDRARALGDVLIVAINSDASVRRLKGEGRPLVGENDRLRVLAALDAVDMVLVFEEDTPIEVIRKIRPDVLVKGGDYSTETIVGHELVLGYGGRVETIPLVGGRSTTGLIEAIRKTGEA